MVQFANRAQEIHDRYSRVAQVFTSTNDFNLAVLKAGQFAFNTETLQMRLHDGITPGGLFTIPVDLSPRAKIVNPTAFVSYPPSYTLYSEYHKDLTSSISLAKDAIVDLSSVIQDFVKSYGNPLASYDGSEVIIDNSIGKLNIVVSVSFDITKPTENGAIEFIAFNDYSSQVITPNTSRVNIKSTFFVDNTQTNFVLKNLSNNTLEILNGITIKIYTL